MAPYRTNRRRQAIQKMRDITHSFEVGRAFNGYRPVRRVRTISAPKLTRITKRYWLGGCDPHLSLPDKIEQRTKKSK